MKQEKFIKVLDEADYSYEMEGDKIVVTHDWSVYLNELTSLPPDVGFKNGVSVYLYSLTSLPPGVEFRNGGNVHLDSLTSIPTDVEFKNVKDVYLASLTSLPPGVEFKNGEDVYLTSLTGGWFDKWEGNIKGIGSKRLLNLMIKKGMFI